MLSEQSFKARLILTAVIATLLLAIAAAAPAAADDDDDDDDYRYRDRHYEHYHGPYGWHWHKKRHRHHHKHKRRKRKIVEHHHHYYYSDDDDDDDGYYRRRSDRVRYYERWTEGYGGSGGGRCNRGVAAGILGGGAGAAIGAAASEGGPAAIIGGALAGVLVGASLGHSIDAADSYCIGETLRTAPDGSTITWNNPDTETSYEVSPKKSYERDDGRYCREFISAAVVAGREQQVYGTACWQPDGSWEIVQAR